MIREAEALRFISVRQKLARPRILDISSHMRRILARPMLAGLPEDAQVAVTVGSRGISGIDVIARETLDFLKENGLSPCLIPAMGSHGGANAKGQLKLLGGYNITEKSMGVPVKADMETLKIGSTDNGFPVFFSRAAMNCGAVIPINRIKAHTNFRGAIESGLCKMLVVGLGKHKGAETIHKCGFDQMSDNIKDAYSAIMKKIFVPFGIAIIENAYGEAASIECVPGSMLLSREPKLLIHAKELAPSIPFAKIDILIVEEMGKEISGDGMDTNIIGRYATKNVLPIPGTPDINSIVVLGLTPLSHGNAIGIGYADYTTKRLVNAIDYNVMYTNALTASAPQACRIPIAFENDVSSISAAIRTAPGVSGKSVKAVWIKNTLNLEIMKVSQALEPEMRNNNNIELYGEFSPMPFDDMGFLIKTVDKNKNESWNY